MIDVLAQFFGHRACNGRAKLTSVLGAVDRVPGQLQFFMPVRRGVPLKRGLQQIHGRLHGGNPHVLHACKCSVCMVAKDLHTVRK